MAQIQGVFSKNSGIWNDLNFMKLWGFSLAGEIWIVGGKEAELRASADCLRYLQISDKM